jgi:hypothetical protein
MAATTALSLKRPIAGREEDKSVKSIVNALDRTFADSIVSLKEIVRSVDPALLYRRAGDASIGEQILRSAAVIEQTFGGLTANLWDDPFEWTLPETLSTPASIEEYLSEVDSTRGSFFRSIQSDTDLSKYIPVPSGEPKTLIELLMDTLVRATEYRGRAVVTLKILSDEGSPRFII